MYVKISFFFKIQKSFSFHHCLQHTLSESAGHTSVPMLRCLETLHPEIYSIVA